jgi:hypothetical protein
LRGFSFTVIASVSEAIQNLNIIIILDCRVALLLAMTKMEIAKTPKIR